MKKLITIFFSLSFTFSFAQKYEAINILSSETNLPIPGFELKQSYLLGTGNFWIVGWREPGSTVGVYDSIHNSFQSSKSYIEGFYIGAEGFFKYKNNWIIISAFGEEDMFWEIKIHEFSEDVLKYKGSISIAEIEKDSILGDVFVFPIDKIEVSKTGSSIFLRFSNGNYMMSPGTDHEKAYPRELEFKISDDRIEMK
jgi:hypothetical protein